MPGDNDSRREVEKNLSTVGAGGIDQLFDELESTIESLDEFADDLEGARRRIEANDGATADHVRNRILQDADPLSEEVQASAERLQEALEQLERSL